MTCSVSTCDRAVRARGYCNRHYENWRTTGDPVPQKWRPREWVPCAANGCDKRARSRGYCNRHYENWRLRGTATPIRDLTGLERLQVVGWTVTPSGCWEWAGNRNDQGYGLLSHRRVHRVMFEAATGQSPRVVRHTCDNPPCLNPDHLLAGDQRDNVGDMVTRGRHYMQARSHCSKGHDLAAPGAVKVVPRGDRIYKRCVECDRRCKRDYMHRKRG